MAAESLSLLEFLRELATNTQLRDRFAHDPQAALAEYGLDLSPDDVHDALVLAEDNLIADFSRDYTAGHPVSWAPPPVGHDDIAFGAGDASVVDVTVGDGGAFASGAAADGSDNSWHDVDDSAPVSPVDDSYQDHNDHGVDHSGAVDVDASTHDLFNRSTPADVEHH